MREIILDTESTGLDPFSGDRVIEIGALEMKDKILTGKKFHHYINPERDIPYEAYRIHGISLEFLKDKPLFKEVADDFWSFIEGAKIVAHNAKFDVKFLNYELGKVSQNSIDNQNVIDTLSIARRKFPGAKATLDALCKRFKVDNSNREFHGALKDAALLAEVYIELSGGRQSCFVLKTNDKEKTVQLATKIAEGNKIVKEASEEENRLHKEFMIKVMENAK